MGRGLVGTRGRCWVGLVGALLMPCLPAAAKSASAPAGRALRILESYEVAGEPSSATDVRWAGERSVYLARQYDGVSELRLEKDLPRVRQMVPNRETLGLKNYRAFSRLAVSKDFLAWGQWVGLVAWRSLAQRSDGQVNFEWKAMAYTEDVDLAGDRLLVLGAMYEDPAEYRNFSPDGAVAFLGSVREESKQAFKPILFDPAGPGALHLLHCGKFELGGARFLADGSFFIVPGFQPGAHLFSAEGALVRTWNTALLGLDADADCASMTMDASVALDHQADRRAQWLNEHRVVDAVLPLPSGPALVIRSVAGGKVRWELDVLAAGRIETYDVPVAARSVRERLRGDYLNGRIILLTTEEGLRPHVEKSSSRLVVLELPRGGNS